MSLVHVAAVAAQITQANADVQTWQAAFTGQISSNVNHAAQAGFAFVGILAALGIGAFVIHRATE